MGFDEVASRSCIVSRGFNKKLQTTIIRKTSRKKKTSKLINPQKNLHFCSPAILSKSIHHTSVQWICPIFDSSNQPF
ncbi:hypothetical protein L6452_35793 [Arctium lappa]|uniref:Uncharacterized protein n=1 Tax=Arctium lappa TaxID=4217 RepID=A0ACB8Y6R2_ARCLA|nr:hypothetical protein L6452_35793 [Arctium lappa]